MLLGTFSLLSKAKFWRIIWPSGHTALKPANIKKRDGIYRECTLEHFLPISKQTQTSSAYTEC